jgi:hypothetical protein
MSKIKSPSEKKQVSLERDRRNTYGDNAKSSRKNIPKGKQRSHRAERRAANAPLHSIKGVVFEETAVQSELTSHIEAIKKRRNAFKKSPDQPLGLVLAKKAKLGRKTVR